MTTNLERYRSDLTKLIELGELMRADIELRALAESGRLTDKQKEVAAKLTGKLEAEYQRWYSESLAVIRQLLPARLGDFESLYKGDARRKVVEAATYTIQDWLLGIRAAPDVYGKKLFNDLAGVAMRFATQAQILEGVKARFETSLFEIRQLVQADLFDSELEASRELLRNGFLRAAGVVAGVVLEKHLQEVCNSHSVPVRKKNPTIGDLNDALKEAGVVDVPTWRQIQRLGDLRNLCGHKKPRDSTKDEVAELIEGCAKIAKTIY